MTSLNGKDHTFHGRPEKECSAKPNLFGQENLEHLVYLGSNRFALGVMRCCEACLA